MDANSAKLFVKEYWQNFKSQNIELIGNRDERNKLYDKYIFEKIIPFKILFYEYNEKIKREDRYKEKFKNPIFGHYTDGKNYNELFQILSLYYLIKLLNRKFIGKEWGYIINSLKNVKKDYFRNRQFTRDIYEKVNVYIDERDEKVKIPALDDYSSQTIDGENRKESDYNGDNSGDRFIIKTHLLNNDYDFVSDEQIVKKDQQIENELNLFLPDKWVPFSKKRKFDHYEIIPTNDGVAFLHTVRDKVTPDFPLDYTSKIIRAGKSVSIKKLFFNYIDKVARPCSKNWNNRMDFTYKNAITQFCNAYKYNGWITLNRYAKEFREKSGIQGEYYFHKEIKRVINKINYKTKTLVTAYGMIDADEYCTQSNICKELNLEPNHMRVCLYLEYLVYTQQIKYNENDHTYRVLK